MAVLYVGKGAYIGVNLTEDNVLSKVFFQVVKGWRMGLAKESFDTLFGCAMIQN